MSDVAILEDGLGKGVVLRDPSGTNSSNEPVGDMEGIRPGMSLQRRKL